MGKIEIDFRTIDLEQDYRTCAEFRQDSYFCSFGSIDGFKESIAGYESRIRERLSQKDWFYFHLWVDGSIVGQLEFKTFSQLSSYGYIHLVYVVPELRGAGVADTAHEFVVSKLQSAGLKGAILSVSRLRYYERHGWSYYEPNPKHEVTDFYKLDFV